MSDGVLAPSLNPPLDALPVDLDYVPEDLRIRARSELLEDEDKVAQSLQLLRSRLQGERNLRWQDDDLFLLAFLRARKFDVDRAFSLLKGFYTNMGKHGDLYYTADFDRLKVVMDWNQLDFLPYRDSEGSVIFLYRCGLWDPDATRAEEHMMLNFLGIMQSLRCPSTQISGYQLIADFQDYSARHLFHTTPSVLKFFTDMIQNALPVRMRGFHVVNQNHLYNFIWDVIKYFLSKKIRDRIHLHGRDIASLHKFFDPGLLPEDLGGELPPRNTEWQKRMIASTDYLKHVLSFGYENYLSKNWRKKSKASSDSQQVINY